MTAMIATEDYRRLAVAVEQARTVAELREGYYELPDRTTTGIVCGQCARGERELIPTFGRTYHASVAHVRHCHRVHADMEAEARSERESEQAVERFYEEGPHGGTYAGSQEEARDRWTDSLRGE